ncbi:hypothetical protein AX14_012126 [Amanita brunnescens Koide BX004]|nr:hypothetical protein AX14_012126 [Amanita brunnescens Koide BX004]
MELTRNTGVSIYRAKQKEVAGDGTELANTLLTGGIAPLVPLPAAPEIGASIAPTINTHGLSHQIQIIQLQSWNPAGRCSSDQVTENR